MTELEQEIKGQALRPLAAAFLKLTRQVDSGEYDLPQTEEEMLGITEGLIDEAWERIDQVRKERAIVREQQTGHCSTCGSKIQQSHKEILSRSKLDLLQMAAKHVIESGAKDFKKKDVGDFAENPSNYNNFQKLRYHGLIAQTDLRDHWVITRNAWAFLRGDKELPRFVLVRNNHIVDRSPELINAKDVWKGNPEVITYFEYYDDEGKYVGVRPNTVPMVNQAGLF